MDPVIDENWKTKGYQYRLDFTEDIKDVLAPQQYTALEEKKQWESQWNSYCGEWFPQYVDPEYKEPYEDPDYWNGDPYSWRR